MRQGHQDVARARAHLGGPTGGAGVAGVRWNGAQGGAGVRASAKTVLWSTGEWGKALRSLLESPRAR